MSPAGGGWIDVSVPLRHGMVHWPDDPPVEIGLGQSIAGGDPANVTRVSMSAHSGTHMDAPRHFLTDGPGIDAVPLEAVIGPARLIEIEDPELVRERELRRHGLQRGERILLKTRNCARAWWEEGFDASFVHIEPAAASRLAESGIRLVGVDYLSVGGEKTGTETHLELLGAGIWIIEGLDLTGVGAGEYEMICLPLRIAGADGAPARVLLRPTG